MNSNLAFFWMYMSFGEMFLSSSYFFPNSKDLSSFHNHLLMPSAKALCFWLFHEFNSADGFSEHWDNYLMFAYAKLPCYMPIFLSFVFIWRQQWGSSAEPPCHCKANLGALWLIRWFSCLLSGYFCSSNNSAWCVFLNLRCGHPRVFSETWMAFRTRS